MDYTEFKEELDHDAKENYHLGKEMTESEADEFFNIDFIDVSQWTEGSGRATVDYEIFTDKEVYVLSSEQFAFDDFGQTRYYFITIIN